MATRKAVVPEAELVQRVAALVREANAALTPTAIGEALGAGVRKASLDAALKQLVTQGRWRRPRRGSSTSSAPSPG